MINRQSWMFTKSDRPGKLVILALVIGLGTSSDLVLGQNSWIEPIASCSPSEPSPSPSPSPKPKPKTSFSV